MENNNKGKSIFVLLIGLFAFTIMVTGVSYAYFVYNKDVAVVDLKSGSINISFSSTLNTLTLSSFQPINDGTGMILEDYVDFSITSVVDEEDMLYEIEIVPKSGNTVNTRYVKFYLTDQNDNIILSPFSYDELYNSEISGRKALYQKLIEATGVSATTVDNYRLRTWIDESYLETTVKTFNFDIYLYAKNVIGSNMQRISFNTNDSRTNYLVKYVTLGEGYGNMPTPIKDGYTFSSWNNSFIAQWNWNNYKYNDEVGNITINGGVQNSNYITLNGSSNFINIGQITNKKEVSVQATVKIDNSILSTGEYHIISNSQSGGFVLYINNGYANFGIYLNGYNTSSSVISQNTIDTNIHNITGIYDGRFLKLYIDGKLDNTEDLSSVINTNSLDGKIKNPENSTTTMIGCDPSGNACSGNYFKGNVYSVKIYDYVLSEFEIQNNIKKEGIVRLAS